MTHKIILDTDPGIDDAMAILFAEAHPAIELLAITTVFGNCLLFTSAAADERQGVELSGNRTVKKTKRTKSTGNRN